MWTCTLLKACSGWQTLCSGTNCVIPSQGSHPWGLLIIGKYITCFSISETETGSSESGEQKTKKKKREGGVNREIITELAVQQTQLLIGLLYCSKRLEMKLNVYLFNRADIHNTNTKRTTICTLLMSLKRHKYLSIWSIQTNSHILYLGEFVNDKRS